LADFTSIYADLNKHMTHLGVMPAALRASPASRRAGEKQRPQQPRPPGAPPPGSAEIDVMSLFRRMASQSSFSLPGMRQDGGGGDGGGGGAAGGGFGAGDLASGGFGGSPSSTFTALAPTPSGYVPGAPIISSVDLHEGLTRLQAGQTDFDVGGAQVAFAGVPDGMHNVLRDLQESPLGRKANQLESMTIEMVAMLFDFIFETRDLPDGIKVQLGRLQIPVLKAAMLD